MKTRNKTRVVADVLLALVSLAFSVRQPMAAQTAPDSSTNTPSTVSPATKNAPTQQRSISIGAGSVLVDTSLFDVFGNVQAFIPTGGTSPLCLVTFNESNFAGSEGPVFCDARDFQGLHGIRITFGFPFGLPPNDFFATLTVYQPGAGKYGKPILYTGP